MIGRGARFNAGGYALNLGAKKVLLVTDENVQKAGHVEDIAGLLSETGVDYVIYDRITPNPKDYEVSDGAELYINSKCDCIIAVGGGSPIDCAKGIAILATNGGNISDYEGVDMIPEPIPPMICIPTTAGTSADVSQFAIITNSKLKYKMAIISKMVVPDVALIDAETLTTMDAHLTATTGMDALTHAIEALVSTASCTFTDIHAIDAIRLIINYLPKCLQYPENLDFRTEVMRASLEAGIAFSNASLGAVHAIAHSLGGFLDLPHGECNAVLLPHIIKHNFPHNIEKYIMLARAFGFTGDVTDIKSASEFVIDKINNLNKEVGITRNISQMGVKLSDIATLSEKAFNDPCMITNPVEMSINDITEVFENA